MSQVDNSVPVAITSQAVELLQLYDRAGKETARILDDISAAIDHFCAFYTGLIKVAENASAGLRALLLRKAITTESVMADIRYVAGKHFPNLCSMPHVLNEFHSNSRESSAELECEVSLDIFDSDINDDEDGDIVNSTV